MACVFYMFKVLKWTCFVMLVGFNIVTQTNMQFKPEERTFPPAVLWLFLTMVIYC